MSGLELGEVRPKREGESSSRNGGKSDRSYTPVLPVLFLEFLAISLTKSLIPKMLVEEFGDHTYVIVGIMETIKGILAFISCPAFGKLSDRIGRKYCLLVTVIGTTAPICLLVFTRNMYVFAFALSLSGFFSATFPLTFAYISDCVVDKKQRAPAYGLALATFGLSFSLGPLLGSYIAIESSMGPRLVFMFSALLVFLNIIYVLLFLPETVPTARFGNNNDTDRTTFRSKFNEVIEYLPNTWNVWDTFRIFRSDEFMTNLALIVFLYYTSIWAIVSTLMVYVTRQLNFDSVTLGWLLSGYGLATMFSEGILVRLIVPILGELNSMRLGLVAFSLQCIVVAFSQTPAMIFVSVLFSMLANLVYPSISSLVSKIVDEDIQGEALGALNGIKALTEGFGPLFFGMFMSLFERHPMPGAPYLLASILSFWAFLHCYELPPEPELVSAKYQGKEKGHEEAEGLLSESRDSFDGN